MSQDFIDLTTDYSEIKPSLLRIILQSSISIL